MNNKNISSRSGSLLRYMYGQHETFIDYPSAFKALPGSSVGAVRELLSDMTRRGLIMRLKEGKYAIIPYEQDSESYMPDWHLIAAHLVNDADHYIAYYSALQLHNLITQPSLKEQIVVSRQQRPSVIHIKGIPFQFIYHNTKHFFGATQVWVDPYNQVWCSDVEKTIIDCLFKPHYAGGMVEIAKALHALRKKIDYEKLHAYALRFGSQAVMKRLGFMLQLLDIDTAIVPELKKKITASFVLLDTELPATGKYISHWSIRQNLDTNTMLSAIRT
jgi:predicted transcriptional regulator of viral defense system